MNGVSNRRKAEIDRRIFSRVFLLLSSLLLAWWSDTRRDINSFLLPAAPSNVLITQKERLSATTQDIL